MVQFNKKLNTGFVILEVIMGIAITSIIILIFLRGIFCAISLSQINRDNLLAQLYISESVEIMRELETSNWALISDPLCDLELPCHYHFVDTSGAWGIATDSEILVGKFTRDFYIEDVYRNQSDFPNEIVLTGGVLDNNTKKVTHQISWESLRGTQTLTIESYIYNYE